MDVLRDDLIEDSGAELRLTVPPTPGYAKFVRNRFLDFLAQHAVPEIDADDFVTAVGEALANAIEHGKSGQPIEASCRIVGSRELVGTVVDGGVGFSVSDQRAREVHGAGGPYAERGRGFGIMRECADRVVVRSTPGRGTTLVLTRYVRSRHLHAVT